MWKHGECKLEVIQLRRLESGDAWQMPNKFCSCNHSVTGSLNFYLLQILEDYTYLTSIHSYFLRVLFSIESVVFRLVPCKLSRICRFFLLILYSPLERGRSCRLLNYSPLLLSDWTTPVGYHG